MKLNDLNKNNVVLGLRKTDPSLRVPTSNSLIMKSSIKDENIENDSVVDQAIKSKDLMDIQSISDPNRNTPDDRRPPQLSNLVP